MTNTEEATGATPRLSSASKTDVGRQREQNEDACFDKVVGDGPHQYGLFVVADGMGGYRAGEIASQLAIETITAELLSLLAPVSVQKTVPLPKRARGGGGRRGKSKPLADGQVASAETREAPDTRELAETLPLEHYTSHLKSAIEAASKTIVGYGNSHKDAHGLGSTVTTALVVDGQVFIANVGDSRTYLFRNGKLQRITQDHSLVERLVQAGQIEREEVYDHPHRNLVYRSLGANRAEVEVDVFVERFQPGDVLLLCSDGLWEMVRDPELEAMLSEMTDPAQTCELMIQRANENGGEDNITAVIARCVTG
jgi:protein phosphatase